MRLKHFAEAFLTAYFIWFFKLLPLDIASAYGGKLARALGPLIGRRAQGIAKKNLAMIYPNMTDGERRQLLEGMWDNLGRTAAELPHLPGKELYGRMEVSGVENAPEGQALFFSAHLGNWELAASIAFHNGVKTMLVYRQANNQTVDDMINKFRKTQATAMIAKGPKNAIKLIRGIKDGLSLAMLIDQKMNDGIPVPFFGRDAMTAPAVAELALRYDLPIVPVRIVRTQGCHFKGEILPPLQFAKTGDDEKDVMAIMTQINAMLESWIREYPDQWFWVHKRWP